MKIAIIGMGLIGGSLGRAFRKYTEHEVYGFDLSEEALSEADKLDAETGRLDEATLKDVDVVIVALKEKDTIRVLNQSCPYLKDGALVMDTCGNKRGIVCEMKKLSVLYPMLRFCGFHPMAGREYSGINHSLPTLFKGAYAILVPLSDDAALEAEKLLMPLGFKDTEVCDAEKHDSLIAYTSQLAHIVSGCYAKNPLSKQHAGFSAGSFNDLTRVARLDADMWTELFINNSDNLTDDIDDMVLRLNQFRQALKDKDYKTLNVLLRESTNCKLEAERAARERAHDRN